MGWGGALGSFIFCGVDSNSDIDSAASSGEAGALVLAKTASMCPWIVGTLWQLADTVTVAGLAAVPRILFVSRSTSKRSEEHTSELQSHLNLVCRLLLEIGRAHV